jgi:ATP/maltotriose-dependent transcriptional regulator MalT
VDAAAAAEPYADALARGHAALEEHRWADARDAFAAALDAERSSGDALDGYGVALWWLDEVAEGVRHREGAYARYRRSGRVADAAQLALWISHQHRLLGRRAAANGWLARAERLLASAEPSAAHGWLALERARCASAAEEIAAHAQEAMEIATRFGDTDLEVFALSLVGYAKVALGSTEDGMTHLDEAAAAATAGEVRNLQTIGETYCSVLVACDVAGDVERAVEWSGFVDDFARRHDITPLFGACRTIYADVLIAAGRFAEAEEALEAARRAHATTHPGMAAPAAALLAELRVRQGRLDEAERLLAPWEEDAGTRRARAVVAIARGAHETAATELERAADERGASLLGVPLLRLLVDARLRAGDVDAAAATAARLDQIAQRTERAIARAAAALALAEVALARGDEAAERHARDAVSAYGALAMPWDTGRARLALARALAPASPDAAAAEARLAFDCFKRLGTPDADAASALLRSLGARAPVAVRGDSLLTPRERDVLALVARGLSNGDIAKTLVISPKTAEHHVSRILAKLGARTRAEAAVQAAQFLQP